MIDSTGKICEACDKNAYYQAVLKRCKKGSLLASTVAAIEAYAHRLMKVREQVDCFLAPSAFLRSKLIERGFPPEKVKHLPHFLPDDLFYEGYNNNDGYLLFMGKLEPIKGIYPLLEACRTTPEVHLVLAGRVEEPLASQLSELLPPNATYVGMKHGKELRSLLQGALAVVLPSLCYENQPFSILEAFACGKPVIASDLGGMTELVKHKERGLLIQPGDVKALSEAMRWMSQYPDEVIKMGMNAYEYAICHHSSKVHYAKLSKIYDQLANRPFKRRFDNV
ncbi:MAG: hypothetical protein DRG83_13370 [Deltaproteobacteria bacterium]|nr:MAG: hypothetical protein DRG83_13370 [Deltaproteobacteria bacterium]